MMDQVEILILSKINFFNNKRNNSGGFLSNDNKHYSTFFSSLRTYTKSPFYIKKDVLISSQNIIKKEYVPLFKTNYKKQRILSAYLSQPKYSSQKFNQ